jgi:hypothetical protein
MRTLERLFVDHEVDNSSEADEIVACTLKGGQPREKSISIGRQRADESTRPTASVVLDISNDYLDDYSLEPIRASVEPDSEQSMNHGVPEASDTSELPSLDADTSECEHLLVHGTVREERGKSTLATDEDPRQSRNAGAMLSVRLVHDDDDEFEPIETASNGQTTTKSHAAEVAWVEAGESSEASHRNDNNLWIGVALLGAAVGGIALALGRNDENEPPTRPRRGSSSSRSATQ